MFINNYDKRKFLFILLMIFLALNSCKKTTHQNQKKDFLSSDIESENYLKNQVATNSLIRYEKHVKPSYNIDSLIDINFKYVTDYSNDVSIFDIDSVKFGRYDLNNDNINEDLEWIVLTSNGKYALLLSKYIINEMPMITREELNELEINDKFAVYGIKYNDSTVRKWLNDEFLINAFSDEEKDLIEEYTISASNNAYNGFYGGWWTLNDKLFLLSIEECGTYFGVIGGVKKNTCYYGKQNGWWWLRSQGVQSDCMSCVEGEQTSLIGGHSSPKYYGMGVRPAFWINLDLLKLKIKNGDYRKDDNNLNVWFKNDLGQWFYYIGETLEFKKGLMTDKRDGQTYYFDPITGVMRVGYVEIDGFQYYFNEKNDNSDNWYELGNGYYECKGWQVKALGSLIYEETLINGKRIKDNWRY